MLSAAVKTAAPAALRPVGHLTRLDTGILFPVIFLPFASRVGTLHKAGVLKIPAIPGAAIPASGVAHFPFARAKPLRFALFFARVVRPTVLLIVAFLGDSIITGIATEGCLSNDAA